MLATNEVVKGKSTARMTGRYQKWSLPSFFFPTSSEEPGVIVSERVDWIYEIDGGVEIVIEYLINYRVHSWNGYLDHYYLDPADKILSSRHHEIGYGRCGLVRIRDSFTAPGVLFDSIWAIDCHWPHTVTMVGACIQSLGEWVEKPSLRT